MHLRRIGWALAWLHYRVDTAIDWLFDFVPGYDSMTNELYMRAEFHAEIELYEAIRQANDIELGRTAGLPTIQ